MSETIIQSLLQGLNDTQRKAVLSTEGPLLILAGAGSGKTRVLTHRVAYLIAQGISPWSILAITFTNKAAKEMKERVEKLVGQGSEEIWISTFHALCVRILRRDGEQIGLSRNFSILDTPDSLSVIRGVLKEKNLDPKKYEPRSVLGKISGWKNEGKKPSDVERELSHRDVALRTFLEIYKGYEAKLAAAQALDFDDLLLKTIDLFRSAPETLRDYQNKFRYIHVDEYQDTNHIQYLLVKMLASMHRNLCVVGDGDQSIYRFRGADVRNILLFERDYPEAKTILLEQNYRSTQTILDAANAVIANNRARKEKNLWTENGKGGQIRLFRGLTEEEEALFLAAEIKKTVEEGYRYGEIAVLYRTNAQSRLFEETLMKANIPYKIVGGIRFYERKEIKDLTAYLRLIANPHDDISFQRIVNVPKRGIGEATLDRLEEIAAREGISLFTAVEEGEEWGISPPILSRLRQFRDLILSLNELSKELTVTEITREVLEKTGYRLALAAENDLEGQSRLENLEEFLTVTKAFDEEHEGERGLLIDFLSDLALVSDIDQLEEGEGSPVTLMTLHSAKGLEFPVVFLVGMEEGIFPHSRSLMDEEEMEEERRLCYVGITRAKERLTLTYALSRTLYGRTNANPPSRFLREIPDELIEEVGREERPNRLAATKMPFTKKGPAPMPPAGGQGQDWKVGEKAKHRKWGVGTVVAVKGEGENMEVTIAFPAPTGIKKLLVAFAPIEKA
ncbi:MAG: DNA helicase PcrA [Thermicanus sp.]|nr:DNA helicase PcrA [Thermicanus sp.]